MMDFSEKGPSLPLSRAAAPRSQWTLARTLLLFTITLLAVLKLLIEVHQRMIFGADDLPPSPAKCPQLRPLVPGYQSPALSDMEKYISSDQFSRETVERMTTAISIPTEAFDDLGPVGQDARWNKMDKFAEYLEKAFPAIHSTVKLEKVNTYALLYTWQGTDPELPPTLFVAHQDVVPVEEETIDEWTHPPFSGHFDGKYIWGRGASDDKNGLVGIMEAVELLLKADFQPRRSVVLAFGFDEELTGSQGARHLAHTLHERYGDDGVAVLVDEGAGFVGFWGTIFALPGVAEKGRIDIEITVRAPGGHSSVPPAHTGIGIASELVTLIEANPYPPHFHEENPFLQFLECANTHSADFPGSLKRHLPWKGPSQPAGDDKLALEAAKLGDVIKYLFTTASAVDMISGGVKANALPENTRLLVSHRVNVGDSLSGVQDKLAHLAQKVAAKHNLTVQAFTDEPEVPRSIKLTTLNTLEPAPVSPTLTHGVTPYSVLSGTTRALYGESMIVAPALMPGNTDSRYYWSLSKHIFRYNPGYDPELGFGLDGIHTVNERISLVGHVRAVQWYSLFIRNMDEAELS
ncbi:peptidase family M20/M25/M40 [Nemania sp. NC0429]|nr:peptidase family M20/M25/M40 [Nemania sp. NC0429]